MSKPPPVIAIGIDAFDVDLMQRWAGEGRLPFLQRMLEEGCFVRMDSTKRLFGDAPWPTANAGVSPATHAFFNHLQLERGTTRIKRVSALDCKALPFWSHLRGTDARVVVVDVPKTFPIEGVDGVQVSAWGEHYPLLREPTSMPPGAVQDILRRFGSFEHPHEQTHDRSSRAERKVHRMLSRGLEQQRRAFAHLLDTETYDFFMGVFSSFHYMGHEAYHYMDPEHWAHPDGLPKDIREAMPRLAGEVDTALASLLEHRLEEARVFVFSVHGFETNYTSNHLLPAVLEGLGYAVPAQHEEPTNALGRFLARIRGVREAIPGPVRDFINARLIPEHVHDAAHASQFSSRYDWTRTRAFDLPGDHFQGLVSINQAGREPQGTVQPGEESEALCREMDERLRKLTCAETGEPLVENIIRVSEVYQGPNLSELPELVIQWTEHATTNRIAHPDFGEVALPGFEMRRTQHAPDGFFIARGPGLAQSSPGARAQTLDMAPTFLHLMGRPIPEALEGRVLTEILRGAN